MQTVSLPRLELTVVLHCFLIMCSGHSARLLSVDMMMAFPYCLDHGNRLLRLDMAIIYCMIMCSDHGSRLLILDMAMVFIYCLIISSSHVTRLPKSDMGKNYGLIINI